MPLYRGVNIVFAPTTRYGDGIDTSGQHRGGVRFWQGNGGLCRSGYAPGIKDGISRTLSVGLAPIKAG